MEDEENKALEILQGFEPDDLVECSIYLQALEKITNLIEKQQKEIEELKEKTKKCEYYEMIADELYKNSVSKDTIKAKIEFIKSLKEKIYYEENVISILQSLLEIDDNEGFSYGS